MAYSITVAPFTNIAAFSGTTGAIQATTKAGLITTLNSFRALVVQADGAAPAKPDFIFVNKYVADKLAAEIDAITAAVTAHA